MKLITGRAGENHVTSLHFRRILESIVGEESYIAPLGNRLSMELAANNTVIINSGMLFHHGGVFDVPEGTYDTVNYNNGTQGMKRIDLIVARYTMDDKGNETGEWAVIQGAPDATDPVAPEYIAGNMQNGDTTEDCPVAEIHFDGIYAVEVKMLLEAESNIADLKQVVNEQKIQLSSLPVGIKAGYENASTFVNTTTITKELDVGAEWDGAHAFIQLMSVAQTPYANVTSVFVSPISGGKATVTFKGNGFVRGHIIGFKYLMIKPGTN